MQSKVILIAFCIVISVHAQDAVLPHVLPSQSLNYRSFIQPESNKSELVHDVQIEQLVFDYDVQIGAEIIVQFKKPRDYSIADRTENLLIISSLIGLEYYSASRKQFRQLVMDAYYFEPNKPDVPIPPPAFVATPEDTLFHVVLETTTFGKNKFTIQGSHQKNRSILQLSNSEKVRWNSFPFIKIADPQQFRTLFFIEEQDTTITLYGFTGVKNKLLEPSNKIAPKKRIAKSLTNRLIALTSWVYTQLMKN